MTRRCSITQAGPLGETIPQARERMLKLARQIEEAYSEARIEVVGSILIGARLPEHVTAREIESRFGCSLDDRPPRRLEPHGW